MSTYRHERTTWTDGFGDTHSVVKFYVPGDDDEWAMYRISPNRPDSITRFMARGPVYMRTERSYPTVEDAAAAIESAHREWLASGDDFRRARGVLSENRP